MYRYHHFPLSETQAPALLPLGPPELEPPPELPPEPEPPPELPPELEPPPELPPELEPRFTL